ncbi:TetR/AcrR family transcriptional regulator [Ureibacillus manganicus]|uniref:HTH tetR-type domain-containing protein n=1 Tax=Ureibacillus manganicus DSM 26584 TaxID=1384049 RepID=A0A0A3I5W5_9BACL|nr:TetR/AcrR family transcriptional regulator [Ureibacillus manganicus]KGR80124.1 hypothetical protein CD29_01830 [Ureibacillus manganicus DSM 26584]
MARGRKVNSNGEKSMKLLREKAIEIFSEYGYFQTKISDIVKAANVTQPTFYLYFESKETLYKEIITEFKFNLEEIFDDTVNEYEHHQDSKVTIQVLLTRIFNYFALNPHLTKIGLTESDMSLNGILSQKFKNICEKFVSNFLNNEIASHIFVQSLIGSVERVSLSALLEENMKPEKLAEEIVNIYFSREEATVSI